jgi:hypothetical protein
MDGVGARLDVCHKERERERDRERKGDYTPSFHNYSYIGFH